MIRIGICEDVPKELQDLKNMVKAVMAQLHRNIRLYGFKSGEDLLIEIDESGDMDIVLLDIEMKGMSGVEAARAIRERNNRTVLIFVSAHDQYCKEIIGVQPFAFLDKPVTVSGMTAVLGRAGKEKLDMGETFVFVKGKKQYSIPYGRIRFFQSERRIIRVDAFLRDGLMPMRYSFYGKLEEVEEKAGESNETFLRIRKSFLVNTRYIVEYMADRVILDDGMRIGISRNYKETVREHYLAVLRASAWDLH